MYEVQKQSIRRMNQAKSSQSRALSAGRVVLIVAAHLLAMGVYVISNRSEPSSRNGVKGASSSRRLSQGDADVTSNTNRSLVTDVLQANAMLIELDISSDDLADALAANDDSSYQGITAVFCQVDWKTQKQIQVWLPHANQSGSCAESREIRLDLADVVRRAREYDLQHASVHSLEVAGVIFHQSRSGSTKLSNLIAAADPTRHRVYTESSPPEQVLAACTPDKCSSEKAKNLLQDVLYLMGRSSDPEEERVFYKFMSSSTRYLNAWTRIFPKVPWMFIYRDPIHVLMSHANDNFDFCVPEDTSDNSVENLMKDSMTDIAKDLSRSLESLSMEEYCATFLASLCEVALEEHETSVPGTFIRYESLPNVVWERVLPKILELPPDKAEVQMTNMRQFAAETWQAENVMMDIPQKLKAAADDFLFDSYYRMRGEIY